ncbi:hypothetical protein AKJ16_DCAP04356 [Drosera capensis]
MNGNSGCLARGSKHEPIYSSDEQPKELVTQGRTKKVPAVSADFWTSSVYDMDNSAGQSQGSMSSISTSIQAHDPLAGVGAGSASSEFTRQRWVGDKKPSNRGLQMQEPKLSWNATYDSLLGSNKPFPQPIPLAEMVDFLVDIWEQEGMS